eukprot:1136674-Pelagomonas_calceolata.AAC.5
MRVCVNLDRPSQDLTNLRAQFQHLCSSAPSSSATRLRDFMNQADVLGLAKEPFLNARGLLAGAGFSFLFFSQAPFALHLSCPRRRAIESKNTHYNLGALGLRAARNQQEPH